MRKKSEVLEKILSSISEKEITECRDRMFLAVLLDEYRREKNISLNDLAQYLHITDEEMEKLSQEIKICLLITTKNFWMK